MRQAHLPLLAALLLAGPASAQEGEAPPPPPSKKASLAVMPFTFRAETVVRRRGGVLELAVKELQTSTLTNKFVTALVNTRKFDVVERQRVDDLMNEIQLSESGLTSTQRAVKAGQMIGADYFLMGEISVFDIATTWKAIPFTEKWQRIIEARIVVDMRIVDTRTSKVVAADKGEAVWRQQTMFPNRFETQELPSDLIDALERDLCDVLTLKTIDGVYPVKIIGITGGTISLNRGEGGGLAPGALLDVYVTGEEMVDPDTGDSLGFEEVKVGRIRVTEVLPRFSKAAAVSGAERLQKGALCRRVEGEAQPADPTPRPRPPGW